MQPQSTERKTRVSELLADPAQVALIRDLYAHARTVRAEHALYAITNGRGLRYVGVEHTWTVDHQRVSVQEDCLVYESHGKVLLSAAGVDSARKVAELLAAIGVLPERFIAAAAPSPEPGNPDRRCRNCGATSGLRLIPGNPLTLADREWQCADQCADVVR